MRHLTWWSVLAAGAVACGDAGGVSPDAIRSLEKAAVLAALECGVAADSIYLPVGQFVLPYVDRASHLVSPGGDTTRVAGIQLEIDALLDSFPVELALVGTLAWTGFDSVSQTVDTTVLAVGTGGTDLPINDSLRADFIPGAPGRGTAFVIHAIPGGGCEVWRARSGALRVTAASFGGDVSQSLGPITLANARGTMSGDFDFAAKLVPDSLTTIGTAQTYSAGVQALRMRVTGEFTTPAARYSRAAATSPGRHSVMYPAMAEAATVKGLAR